MGFIYSVAFLVDFTSHLDVLSFKLLRKTQGLQNFCSVNSNSSMSWNGLCACLRASRVDKTV